ncbi:MAG: LacI family transcriptional regulator [Candidatus Omnitrophica bacterium]|nr:LacI family transcriptional regulator [Candidatus Omnitrophota bacterium]
MATLKDVAKKAGVSVSTVSLVLNNKPTVTEEKRKKVFETIKELNYTPNQAARALRRKSLLKKESFGVLIPAPLSLFSSASHLSRTIVGLEKEIKKIKYHLFLGSIEWKENRLNLPRFVEEKSVDGIVIISTSYLPIRAIVSEIKTYGIPMILSGYPGEEFGLPSVTIDNVRASREATDHLFSEGYPRVATITGPINYPAARERLEGYKLSLLEHNVPLDKSLIFIGDFTEESGWLGMREILKNNQPPFGLFVAGDFMAKGAIRFLLEQGLKVPADVGVVGFDDVEYIVSSVQPALSSVHVPWEEVGATLVRQLLLLESAPYNPTKIILPCELKIRDSSQAKNDKAVF